MKIAVRGRAYERADQGERARYGGGNDRDLQDYGHGHGHAGND